MSNAGRHYGALAAGPNGRTLLRGRTLPLILMLVAVGLGAWVIELGAVLRGQAEVRNWSEAWVGLDLMEIAGLVLSAILLRNGTPPRCGPAGPC
jgi:hypothetical protein